MRSCLVAFLFTAIILISCKTYYIPKESLVEQFAEIDSADYKDVKVRGAVGDHSHYKINPLEKVVCRDKNGKVVTLRTSPSMEVRVTHTKGRSKFYFNRLYVTDSLLGGVESGMLHANKTIIPIKDITLIEVQDGKKAR